MLRLERLKKSFGDRILFENATYHFPEGERIALVGANGAGKTTLLNILCGLDQADDGDIITPAKIAVGYLPQKPNPTPKTTIKAECQAGAGEVMRLKELMDEALTAMEHHGDDAAVERYERAEAMFRTAGGYGLEARATTILRGLGFSEEDLEKAPTALSGGWRMRLELARLFLRNPDFLVLDEPTNHLDLPSLVWVESYLQNFRGTLLFVSHDRALLNRLATVTLHLSGSRLSAYKGNFDAFLEAREERMAREQSELTQLKRRRESMERFVERFGAKATKAAQAQSRVKMIARIRDAEGSLATEGDDASVFIDIPEPPKTPRIVYRVENGTIGYTKPLSRDVNLSIERGAKIAIIGANGIGKSTLLRTIAGRLAPLTGLFEAGSQVNVAYFAQDQTETLSTRDTVLGNLLRASELGEKAARGLLGGFLFRGDDVFKEASVLSGGELSRLGLACTLAKRAGLLLLDEPTNHLDMASVETLAASVDAYEGTVLFVSHDRTFIDAVCTHVFAMLPDGRSMVFPGKLADYAHLAEVASFPNVLKPMDSEPSLVAKSEATKEKNPSAATLSHEQARDLKRTKQKLAARIEQLDRIMAEKRQLVLNLEGQMASADYAKAKDLHAQQVAAQTALEEAESEWLEASEDLERVTRTLAEGGRA